MAIPAIAGATPSEPYSHKDAWFQSDSQGCAGIYRCSCSPVNNYLSATAYVQYNDNGTYKTTSGSSEGTNVQQRAFVVTAPNGCYANAVDAYFEARCGTGEMKYPQAHASR